MLPDTVRKENTQPFLDADFDNYTRSFADIQQPATMCNQESLKSDRR